MTELMKPVTPDEAPPVVEGLETTPSVRELLTELAALEDAMRAAGGERREHQAALAREQEIIDALHRRWPEGADQA